MSTENWISVAGVVVSVLAVVWAVWESRKAERQTQQSAAASIESAEAAKKAVELQEREWRWQRSAILKVHTIRFFTLNEPEGGRYRKDEPLVLHGGLLMRVDNQGGVQATETTWQWRSNGTSWSEPQPLWNLGPGFGEQIRFAAPFEMFRHMRLIEVRVTYTDYRRHEMTIYFEQEPGADDHAVHSRLVAINVDGERHLFHEDLPLRPLWTIVDSEGKSLHNPMTSDRLLS